MPDGAGLLTSEEAADLLGVSNATVLRANRVGSLASSGASADGDPLFSREAVEVYRKRRTELFRGAVRSNTPAPAPRGPAAESHPRPAAPRHGSDPGASEPAGPAATETAPPAKRAAETAAAAVPEPVPDPPVAPVAEAELPRTDARREEPAPSHRSPRRPAAGAQVVEVSRAEFLAEWSETVEWLDRLALSLLPIEGADSAPRSRPPVLEGQASPAGVEPVSEPAWKEPTEGDRTLPEPDPVREETREEESLTANLAVRPVVSFAVLKEIGVALRGRGGVREARLDRLDGGAAWFVVRHDRGSNLDQSVPAALEPLGFSVKRTGEDSFEVVQDSPTSG